MERTRLIANHPLAFALVALFLCLGVYSAVLGLAKKSPIIAAGAACAIALVFYAASRTVFWPRMPREELRSQRRDAYLLVAAAVGSGVVVAALGLLLGVFELQPTDIALWDMPNGETPSPIMSFALIAALCVLTGIYEEALFSAVLFGGLRLYYGETASSSTLAGRLTGRAALVQGVLFAFAHVAGGIFSIAQAPSAVMALQIVVWFVGTFLFGVVTAVLMETGRSLALNAVVHAIYDFALFGPLALQAGTLRATTVTGSAADLALFALQAVVLAAAFVMLYICGRQAGSQTR